MITLGASLLVVVVVLAFLAVLAALGSAVVRRWDLCRKFAAVAVLAFVGAVSVCGLLVWGVLRFGAGSLGDDSASSKASMLARGIAEGMNIAAILVLMLLIATPIVIVKRRRVRKPK
jgi:hypothetical protein